MGDELRGENLVHLNVRFSTETELKKIQDFLYEKSGQGVSFTGLVEAMANEVTIVTTATIAIISSRRKFCTLSSTTTLWSVIL